MRRIALALASGLLVAACSESPPEVSVEVRTSEPTSKPGVSISTRRTVVPQQASPPQAADTRSKDEAPPAPKAASAPTP
jgi:pectin methylesterase-like acyl-CoA thioesterase